MSRQQCEFPGCDRASRAAFELRVGFSNRMEHALHFCSKDHLSTTQKALKRHIGRSVREIHDRAKGKS